MARKVRLTSSPDVRRARRCTSCHVKMKMPSRHVSIPWRRRWVVQQSTSIARVWSVARRRSAECLVNCDVGGATPPRPTDGAAQAPGVLRCSSFEHRAAPTSSGFSCAKRAGAVAIEIQPPLRAHTHDDAHASKRGVLRRPRPQAHTTAPPALRTKTQKQKHHTHRMSGATESKERDGRFRTRNNMG